MISYREDYGLWWPDYATNPKCHGALMKHARDMEYAASLCKERSVCVQAGGNIGVWPIALASLFRMVWTFEPVEANFAALAKNIDPKLEIAASFGALSNYTGMIGIGKHTSIGSQKINPDGDQVHAWKIDDLGISPPDAIFLDIEGHELQALQGAEQTITKHRPIIQVEVNKEKHADVNAWLLAHGYKADKPVGKDLVYTP